MDVWMKGRRPEILALRPAATQVMITVVVVDFDDAGCVHGGVHHCRLYDQHRRYDYLHSSNSRFCSSPFVAHLLGLLWIIRSRLDRRCRHGQVLLVVVTTAAVVAVFIMIWAVMIITLFLRIVMPPEHAHIFR